MNAARSRAVRAARPLQRQAQVQVQCRFESGHSGHHSADQTHPDAPHPVEHANVNESFGARFFLTLAAVPLAWLAYDATTSDAEHPSALTRYIGSYDSWQKEFERRNDQHARLVHQAAFDRNLFGTAQPTQMVDLRFPEQFNGGSPFANAAGHRADLSAVIAHYNKRNAEMEERVKNKTPEQRKLQ